MLHANPISRTARAFAAALAAALVASCAGAPERPAPAGPADAGAATPRAGAANYTDADVAFVQGMIAHHAQALVMTELVPASTETRDIRVLARRIDATQSTEIDWMRRWLEARGEAVPQAAADPHAYGEHAGMPGMLTDAEMERLAAASGAAFDRLFLELMISHHRGALTMVVNLMASEGGGLEPELFRFASDVDADQRAEIARMENLLTALERGSE